MRKCFIILLALLVALSVTSCKAELDKSKIAVLLADYVLNIATGQELDLNRVNAFAGDWALSFVNDNAGEIPARYRDETVVFATAVIPKLIADYGIPVGANKVMIFGPQAEGSDFEEGVVEYLLAEFEEFHDEYQEEK